jgi:hypothetical protein
MLSKKLSSENMKMTEQIRDKDEKIDSLMV